jgi:hypothetical protein
MKEYPKIPPQIFVEKNGVEIPTKEFLVVWQEEKSLEKTIHKVMAAVDAQLVRDEPEALSETEVHKTAQHHQHPNLLTMMAVMLLAGIFLCLKLIILRLKCNRED